MDHEAQVDLLDELLGLRKEKSAYLDEAVTYSETLRYIDEAQFRLERERIFLKTPFLIAHASELPDEGSFLRRDCFGIPILLTRDRDGMVHAFYNVCRHRGARLVAAESGCKHRFSCPYHAWTWDNTGRLITAPHKEQGFPGLNIEEYGLKKIACAEKSGWVWCLIDGEASDNAIEEHLAPIKDDMDWLDFTSFEVHAHDERTWNCNWKILVEGGLEAYHFRVAHAKTIGLLFHDNLSTYKMFGNHIRSILARVSVDELIEMPRKDWRLRDHANVLYNLFPNAAWLVQFDHVVLIQFFPFSVDETRIRCVTLRPKQDAPLTEKQQTYWDKNHQLTVTTLEEDFALGENIQSAMALGVNERLTFGRFEGALHRFNETVDEAVNGV
ncbi:MAG: SRPBCC family protein [Pseudomonadota bacterium]